MAVPACQTSACQVLLITESNLLDSSLESAALRELFHVLAGRGFTGAMTGCYFIGEETDTQSEAWLKKHGWPRASQPVSNQPIVQSHDQGRPVTLFHGDSVQPHAFSESEQAAFLKLIEASLDQQRPEMVLVRAGPCLAEVLKLARSRGVATVAWVPDVAPKDSAPFQEANAVLTHTSLLADYLRDGMGLPAYHLPPFVAQEAMPADLSGPGAVAFDASAAPGNGNGLAVFAQVAEELVRRRPELPLMAIGRGPGTVTLAGGAKVECVPSQNVGKIWGSVRVLLAPVLCWDYLSLPALSALRHGVPVVGSDRGGLGELLDGVISLLSLPSRLTAPAPVSLRPEQLAPWIDTILRLYDDPVFAAEQSERALAASEAWIPEKVAPLYAEFLTKLMARRHSKNGVAGPVMSNGFAGHTDRRPSGRSRSVVLVPHLNGIDWECEQALRQLEHAGVRVVRRGGCSAIDVARNELLSDALHDGAESMMFIDSDIGFDPADALKLLARPEPVISGVYAKKGMRELASEFAPGVKEILFGPDAAGLYPLRYAATGFLRVKAPVLRRMIDELKLPLCNTHWGRGIWPFFMPVIVPHGKEKWHYLGEDWAFSYRLGQIGITPLADTSIRLWHWGRYSFSWEDAGSSVNRYRSYNYTLTGA
jgi:hypothetical protein